MSIEFKWTWYVDEDGIQTDDTQVCDMCAADVPVYGFNYLPPSKEYARGEKRFLCDLCASTPAGSAQQYPRQYEGQVPILQTINYAANAVLLQMGKWPTRPEPAIPESRRAR